MLPLVVPLVGGVAVYALYKLFWDGKQIAVLGSRGVGKTTFWEFLKTKKITNETFEATRARKSYKSITIKEDGLKIKFTQNYDVGGGAGNYSDWETSVNDANYIFYILDIHKVLNCDYDYINHVRSDMDYISSKIRERRLSAEKSISDGILSSVANSVKDSFKETDIRVFLLATHADLQPNYKTNLKLFEQEVSRNTFVNEFQTKLGGTKYCKLILGSLVTTQDAQTLLQEILHSVKEK